MIRDLINTLKSDLNGKIEAESEIDFVKKFQLNS